MIDSEIRKLPLGSNITVANAATPRLMIYRNSQPPKSLCRSQRIELCTLKIHDGNGNTVSPISAVASDNIGDAPASLWDGNDDTCVSLSTNLLGPKYINITLPSTITDVKRLTLSSGPYSAGPCDLEFAIAIGSKTFSTTQISTGPFHLFTVNVAMSGTYDNGLLIRDPMLSAIYRIEDGKRRVLTGSQWKSGCPLPFTTAIDSRILSLPLGEPIDALDAPGNFVAIYGKSLELHGLQITYIDGSRAILSESDIYAETEGIEGVLVTDIMDGRIGLYSSAMSAKLPDILPSSIAKVTANVYGMDTFISFFIKMNGVIYEFQSNFILLSHLGNVVEFVLQIDPVPVSPAEVNGHARRYPHAFKGSFPAAQTVRLNNTRNDQCPQSCDRSLGCVAYGIENGNLSDCILFFGQLGTPVASNTLKVFVASSGFQNHEYNDRILTPETAYFRVHDRLPVSRSDEGEIHFYPNYHLACEGLGCLQQYVNNTASFTMYQPYFDRIVSFNVTMKVTTSYCNGVDLSYKTVGNQCTRIVQTQNYRTSQAAIFSFASVDSNLPLDQHQSGNLIMFSFYRSVLLRLARKTIFEIHTVQCVTCQNRFRFEDISAPGSYICSNGTGLALSKLNSGLHCDWIASYYDAEGGIFIRLAYQGPPAYLFYSLGGNLIVSSKLDTLNPIQPKVFTRKPLDRQYRPAVPYQFSGGQVIKTFEGPSSLCAQVCDNTLGCSGYTIYADKMGCIMKSDVGNQTTILSNNHTVSLVSLVDSLPNELPWQLQVHFSYNTERALLGGRNRTFATGAGIHIHIIDSGITPYRGEKGFFDDYLSSNSGNWTDNVVHADVIAEILRRGIVPGASIHNLKIFDSNKETTSIEFVNAVMDVLQRATDNFKQPRVSRPTIISVSAIFPQNFPIDCIMQVAYKMGVFLVVAAGNDGLAFEDPNMSSPASSRFAMVVGNYDSDFSIKESRFGRYVDIYAAGCGFEDPRHPGMNLCGTSLAAPQVAGVMAKFLQENPEYQQLAPVYTYRVIKSSGIRGILKNTSATTHNVVLSGMTSTIPHLWGEWGHNDLLNGYGVGGSACTLDEALRRSKLEVVAGRLVSSALSASSGTDEANLINFVIESEGNQL